MAQRKRRKIASLLHTYNERPEQVTVLIRGNVTGKVLYEGHLWNTPFGLCSDYVMSYKYAAGLLEIVSTYNPFCGD